MKLVVTRDFAEFKRGEEITDAKQISSILASEHAHYVVAVADTSKE
jgi:hypothetical protein